MFKKIIVVMLIVMSVTVFIRNKEKIYTYDYFYFDTVNSVTIYYQNKDDVDLEEIDQGIEDILKTIEQTFSVYEDDSMISMLNQNKTIEMNSDMKTVVETSLYYCNESNQVYDPTIYPISQLWSISNDNYLPTEDEINQALVSVDCNNVVIDGNTLILTNDATLDLGSIVKGYAADQIVDYLKSQEINQAVINLGGNVSTMDARQGTNGYKVGIANPLIDQSGTIATIEVENKSVVTSGINQRYFVENEIVYHHLIDAKTGYPVDNNLASVTIIADNGIDADSLSTMIFLMGLENGYEYVSNLDGVDAIFITNDQKVYSTTEDFNLSIVDESFVLTQMY